jgi:hypothetical protein
MDENDENEEDGGCDHLPEEGVTGTDARKESVPADTNCSYQQLSRRHTFDFGEENIATVIAADIRTCSEEKTSAVQVTEGSAKFPVPFTGALSGVESSVHAGMMRGLAYSPNYFAETPHSPNPDAQFVGKATIKCGMNADSNNAKPLTESKDSPRKKYRHRYIRASSALFPQSTISQPTSSAERDSQDSGYVDKLVKLLLSDLN